MSAPPVLLLVALCFGAGWGLDAWLGSAGKEHAAARPRIPAMSAGKPGAGLASPNGTAAAQSPAPASAKTLDELLRLADGVLDATARARAEIAIGQLTEAELSAACGELVKRLKANKDQRFPAQITDPLLQRWLAMNPQAALRECVGFEKLITPEIRKNVLEALKTEAREHPEFIARMTRLPQEYWAACGETVKNLPPRESLTRLLAMGASHGGLHEAFSWGSLPERWIAEDPRGALTWALSLPPGTARHKMLNTLATFWSLVDRQEALDFVHALPPQAASAGVRNYLDAIIQDTDRLR